MRLDIRLTKGRTKEEVETLLGRFDDAIELRKVFTKVLTDEIDSLILQEESSDILDSPNALAKLTGLHERRKALRSILNLVNPT